MRRLRNLFCVLALCLGTLSVLWAGTAPDVPEPDQVNLALRRTADKLLRAAGDSTSRIPAVEQVTQDIWRIDINGPFSYDALPSTIQAAFDLYGIDRTYKVAVRRCADDIIDLGFHQQDYVAGGMVPCQTREMPEGCHYIEVTFAASQEDAAAGTPSRSSFLILALLTFAGIAWWWYRRSKNAGPDDESPVEDTWLSFGQSRLHKTGHILECAGERHDLTYREDKLLRLFVSHPGELLERETILHKVWADEGVRVGRSIDMFVSRLRKKLKADPSVGIVAVHGLGYRLVLDAA